jgi:hypothetical protein
MWPHRLRVAFVELVEGRKCGECTVCCTVHHIDTKEFQKPPGISCPHLCAQGCSIYTTRYPICREYHCGWRYLEFLSDNWRPDKSGVLMQFSPTAELPPGYETGVSFILVARPPGGFTRALYHYVAHLIADGVHVMLAVPGPPGEYPVVAFLSEELRQAALRRDYAPIEAVFAEALALNGAPSRRFKKLVPNRAPEPRPERT